MALLWILLGLFPELHQIYLKTMFIGMDMNMEYSSRI